MKGLIGKKIGMSRMFDRQSGHAVPVTVIRTGVNIVQQLKSEKKDGYNAAQLGFDLVSQKKISKPEAGHFSKLGTDPSRRMKEFAFDSNNEEVKPGSKIGVEIFQDTKTVDVTGTTKGRGFTGTVKRHNFHLGPATHGNTNYRERGSLGAGTYPARVLPGVKMAGRYGGKKVTVKRLAVVGIDKEMGLVYVKGAVPGSSKGIVYIHKNS